MLLLIIDRKTHLAASQARSKDENSREQRRPPGPSPKPPRVAPEKERSLESNAGEAPRSVRREERVSEHWVGNRSSTTPHRVRTTHWLYCGALLFCIF
jgi:hypothetical protein